MKHGFGKVAAACRKGALLMMALLLAQVLVLNRIQLFHCATPLLYIYFIIIVY